ncbi:MAG: exodeoxyribonuclease VII small subunit [Planctomycetes bacterium]|nr:exodeoxyribonuclease VII small subunit [Planctomycetota bacterium]
MSGEVRRKGGKEARPKGAPRFEEEMARLEEIVRRLESGELGLDESLEAYQKGVEAVRSCRKILDAAQKRLEVLVKGPDGDARLEPMEEP